MGPTLVARLGGVGQVKGSMKRLAQAEGSMRWPAKKGEPSQVKVGQKRRRAGLGGAWPKSRRPGCPQPTFWPMTL